MATVDLKQGGLGKFSSMTEKTASPGSGPESLAGVKRFHGRLKIDATFCPTEVASPFDTVEWEARTRRDQGRERRSAVRADQLRSPIVLEPVGHQRRLQQILLRRNRHGRARVQRPPADPSRHPHDRRLGPATTATSPAPKMASGSIAT